VLGRLSVSVVRASRQAPGHATFGIGFPILVPPTLSFYRAIHAGGMLKASPISR
jgi:hypothetical protein